MLTAAAVAAVGVLAVGATFAYERHSYQRQDPGVADFLDSVAGAVNQKDRSRLVSLLSNEVAAEALLRDFVQRPLEPRDLRVTEIGDSVHHATFVADAGDGDVTMMMTINVVKDQWVVYVP